MKKINIIMLGESGVGKSSLLYRHLKGVFRDYGRQTYVDQYSKKIDIKEKEITFIFWDTSGQDVFRSLTRNYFRQADGALLVYDVTNLESCTKLRDWLSDFRSANESAEIIVVGNKNENPEEKSEMGARDVKSLVEEENLEHGKASAKSGENVDEIFNCLTQKVLFAKGILDYCELLECLSCSSTETAGSSERDPSRFEKTRCNHRKSKKDDLSRSIKTLNGSIINLEAEVPNNNESRCNC